MIKDIIVDKLYLKENSLILVFDPDNLLSAEDIVEHIRQEGFAIINYEDPETFRFYYEENVRSHLDRGEKLEEKAIIRYTVNQVIPYDIQSKCSFVHLTLREIFPKLSYSIVKELYVDIFERVFTAYKNYSGFTLGDRGTKEFLLKNVYGIIPEIIVDFQQLVKTFIPMYYRGEELPKLIADYTAEVLYKNSGLMQYPINTIIEGKGVFFHFLQEQWELYVRNINGEDVNTIIDFSQYEIRAYIDNLFQENLLSPVKEETEREYPLWMQAGILHDIAGSIERRYNSGIEKLQRILKNIKSYKDWFSVAEIWGEIVVLKHDQERSYNLDNKKFKEINSHINKTFKEWMFENYSMLSSLSYAKSPVIVHKIPWHINHRLPKHNNRKVALLVMDGMALDNWYVIKEVLNSNHNYIFDEALCFAWVPTITSVSRQAIFSGEMPANFADSIMSTNYDDKQWKKFWKNAGYNDNSIVFRRGIKEFREEGLKDILEDNKTRILGIVVNIVDDIMHGQQLSLEGMHQDIKLWTKKGYFQRFLEELFSKGFEVYITSDHGNIGAVGQGTLQEGLAVESPGERVRIYNSEKNLDTVLSDLKAFKWNGVGLPKKYNYVLAEDNLAFTKEDKKIVGHGGLAIEEVVVPFIHIRKED